MTAIGRADTSHVVSRSIRIAGILSVVVLSNNVVVVLRFGQVETALSVSHPDAKLVTTERTEHHAVVLRDGQTEEGALELLADIVHEVCTMLMLGVDEVELHHELTAIADAERQCILTGIELIEGFLGLRIVEEGTGPALGRTQHVAIGETSTEHDHIDLLQGLTAADEVSHHHVLHLKAGQPQRVGHLTVAIGTLLTDDGSHRRLALLCVCVLPTVGVETERGKRTLEVSAELKLQRLLLVVVPPLAGHVVHALMGIEEI